MEMIVELIQTHGEEAAKIAVYIFGINAFIAAILKVLEFVKDKTETNIDNMVFNFLNKISGYMIKLCELLTANLPHKK